MLGLFCLALLVGVVAAGPAAATEPAGGSGGEAAASGSLSVLQPQTTGECPSGYVCFWSGKTYGRAECESGQNCFSAFAGSEVGCHGLENINPQSMFNNTGNKTVTVYNGGIVEPITHVYHGETYQWGYVYHEGMCIE